MEPQLVREVPLGYEWPGSYFFGEEELELVTQVIKAQSPFRYYGLDRQHMCDQFVPYPLTPIRTATL